MGSAEGSTVVTGAEGVEVETAGIAEEYGTVIRVAWSMRACVIKPRSARHSRKTINCKKNLKTLFIIL